ncbi:MAG: hypothetical protein WC225_02760 [Acholeplasmataceae bacterium]
MYEINGNLSELKYYRVFQFTVSNVVGKFIDIFGSDLLNKQKFYVDNCYDNGTANCGYTPIITPILKEYLIIKLGIDDFRNVKKIIFQFAHELTHYVFFCLKGIDKKIADDNEENICTAMSLIMMKILCDESAFLEYCVHVKSLKEKKYRDGYYLAEQLEFSKEKIVNLILENN